MQLVQPVGDGLAVPAEREVERVVDRAFFVALFLLLLIRRADDSKKKRGVKGEKALRYLNITITSLKHET